MEARAAKLALARKKLKDHQEKKSVVHKDGFSDILHHNDEQEALVGGDNVAVTNDCENGKTTEFNQKIMETYADNNDNLTSQTSEDNVNVTEILISNKRILEMQISELNSKLSQLEHHQSSLINSNEGYKQQVNNLENQLRTLNDKYIIAQEEILSRDKTIKEINVIKSSLSDDNSNLQEQLEFTKTMLTAKESENVSLHSHLSNLQNQLDVTQLQLQQLTNGSHAKVSQNSVAVNSEALLQKISSLELQLKALQKEKDQMNLHYEQYVGELNEQLKSVVIKNEELVKEIHSLSNRENNLVEQISDMEIRLQNYQKQIHDNQQTIAGKDQIDYDIEMKKNQEDFENIQVKFQELSGMYDELQRKYKESEIKIKELSEVKDVEITNENILRMSQLNADITSDKIAVQRATEQNKKLKIDLQNLQEDFIKISKDKLELTEKLEAEKFLNRELTIKLSEIEEKAKNLHTKLIAKDEEMIRLQINYRELKSQFEKTSEERKQEVLVNDEETSDAPQENTNIHKCSSARVEHQTFDKTNLDDNNSKILKEDAMLKLQERFLKIMGEVADLSDEKHRLEHIILQLQTETDTICEYVALYQQQRSLLKKRDEERSAQIKIFQSECELLKNQLEELSTILTRLSNEPELSAFFKAQSRRSDIDKVMNLLTNLKNCSLIDPNRKCSELKDFYPCNCCSGKLIDV